MKFEIKILLVVSFITALSANHFKSNCDNPCDACQKAVYQLKFHSIADCGKSRCGNTCHKVIDLWKNSPDKVFESFEKDMFGKCEICFRAGFCAIAECKAQQEMEMMVINQIVGNAKLSSKKVDYLGHLGFEGIHQDHLFYDPKDITDMEHELNQAKKEITKSLDLSISNLNAKNAILEVKKIVGDLFSNDKTFVGKSSVENINVKSDDDKIATFEDANKNYENHISKVLGLKKEVSNHPTDKDQVAKIVVNSTKDIDKKIRENEKHRKAALKRGEARVAESFNKSNTQLKKLRAELSK